MSDLYQFMKNWNPGMGLNDKFREDTLELMNAARAEGYRDALEDVQEMITEILENDTDAALVDIVAPLAQTKSAYEKGSDGNDKAE